MPSDRARLTYDPSRKWRALIAQQGRVTVESDWNESAALQAELDRQIAADFVGPLGTPSTPAPGYLVAQIGGGQDLTISAGTLYVGGERLDLHAPITYGAQAEWLDASSDPLWSLVPTGNPGHELVYLVAFEQEVSAVEDPALADVALGGPDTMGRLRIIQHVVRQQLTPETSSWATEIAQAWAARLTAFGPSVVFAGATIDTSAMRLRSQTTLQVAFPALASTNGSGSADAAPGAVDGYLGAENQLIRVRCDGTDAGGDPVVVWGFDDASFLYRVAESSFDAVSQTTTLTLAAPPVDSYRFPATGQVVELLRDAVELDPGDYIASASGSLATVATAYDPTTMTLTVNGQPPADYLLPTAAPTPAGPEIASLLPPVGDPAGGTVVTLFGSGFTGATAVTFGGSNASGLTVTSDGQITIVTPPGTAGTAAVTVTTPAGTASAPGAGFTYQATSTPAVTALSPGSGIPSGGTLVIVEGSGFTGATTVNFGSTPGTGLELLNDSSLSVVSPAGTGTVDVTVVTQGPDGTQHTSATAGGDKFAYAANVAPQLSGVFPSSGSVAGGTLVTLTGSALSGATQVLFGTTPATGLSVVSDTQVVVVSPRVPAPGSVQVTVTSANGTSPGLEFVYQVLVTAVDPESGPSSGGTRVTFTGEGLSEVTAVEFGGTPGTGLEVVDDTRLTVTAPPGSGTVEIDVLTGGESPSDTGAAFAYAPTPQLYLRVWQAFAVSATTPVSAPDPGDEAFRLTLEGLGVDVILTAPAGQLHQGDVWRFALRPSTPAAVYPARYLLAPQPPDGPRTWVCPLASLDWSASPANVASLVPAFWTLVALTTTVSAKLEPPQLSAMTPLNGSPSGGTVVQITGIRLLGAAAVLFGGGTSVGTGLVVHGDTSLSVKSPPGSGTVSVTVVGPNGTSTLATGFAGKFAYIGISQLSPAVGPPGTKVTVTGAGFTGATAATFGGTAGTAFAAGSDTQITVTAPAGAGQVPVAIDLPSGPSTDTATFVYLQASGISPAAGPTSGGTQVTITGSGFAAAGVGFVQFGGVGSVPATVVSDTQITCSAPASGTASTVAITLSTQFGATSGAATALQFTYQGKSKETKDTAEKNVLKEVRADKLAALEKVAEKVLEKTFEKVAEKVTLEKAIAIESVKSVEILPRLAEPSSTQGASKPAEAKPAEGTVSPSSGEPAAEPASEVSAADESGGATPFIEGEEVPDVGGDIVGDEEEPEH